MTDTLTDIDLDALTAINDGPHIPCCLDDRFYCGAPFHPESVATEADDEDECCDACVETRYHALCPPRMPTHQHCPFTGARCPQARDGDHRSRPL